MTAAPTLREQIAAVERAAINHRGHCENLRTLVSKRKRPEHELQFAASWLPALEAAAETMRRLAKDDGKGTQLRMGGL